MLKTYVCGCVNRFLECGTQRSVSKCPSHVLEQREVGTLGEDYYRHIDALDEQGQPRCSRYVNELTETLGEFKKRMTYRGLALEVGCGASPYTQAILDAGYDYVGIDPSSWATEFVKWRYGVATLNQTIEEFDTDVPLNLILMAHSLEHMQDAPGAIRKTYDLLGSGGLLYLIIPDNTDPLNPDHLWFFSQDSLNYHLTKAGYLVERFEVRKRIERENFIYVLARKPN